MRLLLTYTYNYFISMKPVRFDEPYYNIIKSRVRAIRVDYNIKKPQVSISNATSILFYITPCYSVGTRKTTRKSVNGFCIKERKVFL